MTKRPEGTPLKLDSPLLVHWEYFFEAVRECEPKRLPTLVTATLGEGNMAELWEAVGDRPTRAHVVFVARKAK